MGMEEVVGEMEGWLYLLRSNRIGWQCSKKRYFVLEGNSLRCFRSALASKQQDSLKSALIDCCIRVTDNGRLNFHRKVFYIFTIYNALDHNDRLKLSKNVVSTFKQLGARSSEEAAKWISCFKEAAQKECLEQGVTSSSCGRKQWKSFSLSSGRVPHPINYVEFLDWTLESSAHSDRVSSDVIAPSPWRIFGCHNGLRLFKETKDGSCYSKRFDDHPAIMAVGVVEATPESIFQTLMSLGSSRLEWDFCFLRGHVVESLDGHTDIIHKQLINDWSPWGMRRRDLLLRRYWRREDDGTYVILYHSVFHRNCLPKKGSVRACLKSGGYVISPVTNGKRSVVKHMLAIDWKFWKSYLFASSAKSITIRMLGRVAALRELFRARTGNHRSSDLSSGELTKEIGLSQSIKENIKEEVQSPERNMRSEDLTEEDRRPSPRKLMNLGGSFIQLNDAADEFFDVQEESEYETPENSWTSEAGMDLVYSQDLYHGKLSAAAGFMRKLHGLAVQKKGYVDLQEQSKEDSISCIFGTTLPKDPTFTLPCSWAETEPSTFLIRGGSYLQDCQKVKAKNTLMEMVASDWLKSDKREDNLGGRPGSVVQKYAEKGGNEFFFIVNIQVPGFTTYNLVLYYMLSAPVEQFPLLDSFIKGDDAYRNPRFKLIPYISKGSWIVKQSVGKKACLVGQALNINYFQGRNYLELGIDIGSSTVARGVVSLVLGYLNNLVIEMAFLIQANTQEELPEELIGTCRLNHLDASKAVTVTPD